MGAGEREGQGVELLAQGRQGGGAMWRGLTADGHAQFVRRRLPSGAGDWNAA